ncbi:MAG TPA: hypothetical protein VEF04_06925 [Blastocatellia bacterium]|nr:hypothetical protein [Blastocatellia bacterium]
MTNEEILKEINSLPPEGQLLVENFLAFLRQRYAQPETSAVNLPLQNEKFIGMWQDRDDVTDSTNWVRNIRESEWGQ